MIYSSVQRMPSLTQNYAAIQTVNEPVRPDLQVEKMPHQQL